MRAHLALAAAGLALAACHALTPSPGPARTAEQALVELGPAELPAFADGLEYAGLDEALERSLGHLSRLAAADPGRVSPSQSRFGESMTRRSRVIRRVDQESQRDRGLAHDAGRGAATEVMARAQ